MFRWCAYCQRLIGEREPLVDYQITHGVCDVCVKTLDTYTPERSTTVARDLLQQLTRLGERGDLTQCDEFVGSALSAGLRPSEILIGILHPALADIGTRWERGEIRISDEHRFTAFAVRVLELVPLPETPISPRPPIVLALAEGNQHDLGIQMLQRVALERGHPCIAIHPGLPDDEVVQLARELRPSILGLSVSMPDAVPKIVGLCERLRDSAGATRVVLGGNAFRQQGHTTAIPAHVRVLRSLDDFLLALRENRGVD